MLVTLQIRLVLYVIGRAEQEGKGIYLTEINEQTELPQATVSVIVHRLEHVGWLKTTEVPNPGTRPRKYVQFADKGRQKVPDIEELIPKIWRK